MDLIRKLNITRKFALVTFVLYRIHLFVYLIILYMAPAFSLQHMIFLDLLSGLPACVYVHLSVYTYAKPRVKTVLGTNIMTKIGN